LTPVEAANVIIWCAHDHDVSGVAARLHPGIEWAQIDSAGVDHWFSAGLIDGSRVWTCAKGQYGAAVAEHAMALILAGLRRFKELVCDGSWVSLKGEILAGKTVGILGAGGIGRELIVRLAPFGVRILALTEPGGPVEGAHESLGPDQMDVLLGQSDIVVVAAPLTPRTRGLIGRRELDLIGPEGWLVNVSRGGLVQTGELVAALQSGRLRGACLDVTEPEPLEPGHPLWDMPNVLVTSHTANAADVGGDGDSRLLAYARLTEQNVRRFAEGKALIGVIDPGRGY
jgi:phosphoglycerate dehydrogenase-like enzyme